MIITTTLDTEEAKVIAGNTETCALNNTAFTGESFSCCTNC